VGKRKLTVEEERALARVGRALRNWVEVRARTDAEFRALRERLHWQKGGVPADGARGTENGPRN
jgi:hypothetical protein